MRTTRRPPSRATLWTVNPPGLGARTMTEIAGVSITDVTSFGWSDDGEHIWVTHRLADGSEYPLVYPYVAAGQFITMLIHATQSAATQRAARDAREPSEGTDANVIPVEEVRISIAPGDSGAILHLTTADNVPIAVGLSVELLAEVIAQARRVLEGSGAAAEPAKGRLH
jgi:hypothetical protein